MDLRTPHHLGGRHYVEAVTVGRDPDDDTVRDCPACGGHVFDDDWHLVSVVRDTRRGDLARHHYCSDDCLRDWLRTALEE